MNQSLNLTTVVERSSNEQYVVANNIRLAYDEFGDINHPPLILIMGLGTQMIAWPDTFCQSIAEQGFRVIRFDNRDVGLSDKINVEYQISIPKLLIRQRLGLSLKVPYTLHDMAEDTIGLLDALEIKAAHIVGASMGGMISQLLAANYPERCLSLTSIMSTTGNPALPAANWRVTKQLISRPQSVNEEAIVAHGLKTWRIIGSPDFPASDEDLRVKILRSFRRCSYPMGFRHQMAAIIKTGDRRDLLKKITAPTLVIHGKEDVLVPMQGGMDTAKNINGAQLKLIEGMGHDLPLQLQPRIARYICRHIDERASN